MKVKVLVTQLCLTLCNPMDYSPPGSSVHGILQARTLEWGASGEPFAPPGDLPDPGIKPGLLHCRQILYRLRHQGRCFRDLLLLRPRLRLQLRRFSRVRLCATPETAAHQAPPSRDSPGKNTGVGCHFLLQFVKVKSESEVAQLCLTPSNPMDCGLPGFSVHGICQARVLEWGAIAFSV